MTSETPVGWASWGEILWLSCRTRRERPLRRCPACTARASDVTCRHVGVLHEGGVLLKEGRGYSTKGRGSCSTHHP